MSGLARPKQRKRTESCKRLCRKNPSLTYGRAIKVAKEEELKGGDQPLFMVDLESNRESDSHSFPSFHFLFEVSFFETE